jgi:RNA polymerase sigma-70 factor (ECF subfamily)
LTEDKGVAYLPGPSGERALCARLQRGEEQAMAELYEIHAPNLLRFLGRFLRDRALAEDALQDTFISAFQNIGLLTRAASLRAWLGRIAVRKALNLQRSSSRRARAEGQRAAVPDPEPDPGMRDTAHRVLLLMQDLDPGKRLVLLLVTEGYSAADISEATGEPRSTVLSRICRARIELARLAAASGIALPQQREEPGP